MSLFSCRATRAILPWVGSETARHSPNLLLPKSSTWLWFCCPKTSCRKAGSEGAGPYGAFGICFLNIIFGEGIGIRLHASATKSARSHLHYRVAKEHHDSDRVERHQESHATAPLLRLMQCSGSHRRSHSRNGARLKRIKYS